MAKIKVVKKEKSLEENMTDEYKQMLNDTGAEIVYKDKTGNYQVMSSYSFKPKKRERGQSKKKKRK